MQDEKGLYYYPNPQNRETRMYVRLEKGEIQFRLWNREDPSLWEDHGWLGLDVLRQAAALNTNKSLDPLSLYDENVAKALLKNETTGAK